MEDRIIEPMRVTMHGEDTRQSRSRFLAPAPGFFPPILVSRLATDVRPCGASSIMAWVDPARELVFVGLTSGLIEEPRSLGRWHLFSDLVQACVVD